MGLHLIIGASGQVGEHLLRAARDRGLKALGTYNASPLDGLERLDVRDRDEVFSLVVGERPRVVYLPASLTHVDYCELHPEESRLINVSGAFNVIDAATEVGAKVVYFSSDYVFDGRAGGYSEESEPNPICEYGRQKLAVEDYVSRGSRNYLIVRTAGVFSWERQGKNFVSRLVQNLRAGADARVPADQINNSTYAPDLARAVFDLTLAGETGIFHVAGREPVSRYNLACEAARAFGLDPGSIKPCATAELSQAARRPLNAGMVVEKVAGRLKRPMMNYREGLDRMAAAHPVDAPSGAL